MLKKPFYILATSTLLIGLTACGGMTDQSLAPQEDREGLESRNGRMYEDSNDFMNNEAALNISASETTIGSDKYPHTKAVLIQDAKYKYVNIDPNKDGEWQQQLHNEIKQQLDKVVPNQQKQQAPVQEQPKAQTKQQTPAQQQPKEQTEQAPAQQQPKEQTEQAPAQQQPKEQTEQAPAQQQSKAETNISQYAQQVIDLTNQERKQAGLPALKADAQLSDVALKKSQDMQQNNYFSHTSPTYGSPFDMMRDFGVSYTSAGENIAQGQPSPEEVVDAWMNSPGHKANILSEKFTHIGVGHEQSGNHWTQMFISK